MGKSPFFEAVIFDIDNVLVDTRKSYLDAIRWTVEIYLSTGNVPLFLKTRKTREPELLAPRDVHQFKLLGGFNDDWDCCYGLLVYLLRLPAKKRTLAVLKKTMDLRGFAAKVKERPLRVSGIVQRLGANAQVTVEKIARIFQEVYLGKDLFEQMEHRRACYWKKRGLIHKERLLFRRSTLEKLKKHGVRLGIATGRPHFEAVYALKRFGILGYFDAMTTIDEVKAAENRLCQSLRKPHPFSLLETVKKLGAGRSLYVGDLPDDILAAHRARAEADVRAAAFPWYAADPREALSEMRRENPEYVLRKPSELSQIVLNGQTASERLKR